MFFVAVSVELSWWRISFRTANAQGECRRGSEWEALLLGLGLASWMTCCYRDSCPHCLRP